MEKLTNRDLYNLLKKCDSLTSYHELYNKIKTKCNVSLPMHADSLLKNFCKDFCDTVDQLWKDSYRNQKRFYEKNTEWLQQIVSWPEHVTLALKRTSPGTSKQAPPDPNAAIQEDIQFVHVFLSKYPRHAAKVANYCQHLEPELQMSPDEVVEMIERGEFKEWEYVEVRRSFVERGIHMFPSWSQVERAKESKKDGKDEAGSSKSE